MEKKEQLKMICEFSPITLPEAPKGYYIRGFKEGDEKDWCKCCIGGELGVSEVSTEQFESIMLTDKRVDISNIYFICHESGEAVGTTTYQFGIKPGEGYIHMVGIVAAHLGKGLSRYMTLYVMQKIYEDNNKTIVLTTDDWRLPAIKTYLNCGFQPCITENSMVKRWEIVYKNLGLKSDKIL